MTEPMSDQRLAEIEEMLNGDVWPSRLRFVKAMADLLAEVDRLRSLKVPSRQQIAVKSSGGHYDDDSFAAGWECAAIDACLAAGPYEFETTVHPPLLAQLDLIAMRHGYVAVTKGPVDDDARPDDWVVVMFERGTQP